MLRIADSAHDSERAGTKSDAERGDDMKPKGEKLDMKVFLPIRKEPSTHLRIGQIGQRAEGVAKFFHDNLR